MRYKNKIYKENQTPQDIISSAYIFLKRFLILPLLIVLTAGISGCINTPNNESIILAHLSEKYNGQEFISRYMTSSSYFGGDPVLYCYPKGGDPYIDEVTATMSTDKNGERRFDDTYFGIIMREDVEAEIVTILTDINLPMKVYFDGTSSYLDEIFDGTKTYADFKQWETDREYKYNFKFEVNLLCKDIENREQYANQIFDKLEKAYFNAWVSVCVFSENTIYKKITRKNKDEIFDPDGKTIFLFQKSI